MPKAEIHQTFDVSIDRVFEVIGDFEKYPEFIEGCHSVEVDRSLKDRVRAHYNITVLGKDLTYVLDHFENKKTGVLRWELVESNFLKDNSGQWRLKAAGKKTEADYELSLEFKVPVPSFMINRALKNNMLPDLVKSFASRAKEGSKSGSKGG